METKLGQRDVDRILLVGGSSRMPMVKQRVDAELGIESEIHDPDECVAKGAVVWAVKRKIDALASEVGYDTRTGQGDKAAFDQALEKEMDASSVRNRQFYLALPGKSGVNVVSHTYGILAWDQDTRLVAPLLPKNTEIPFVYESAAGQFGTAQANQATIDIVLMEADGDSLDPDHCKEIGRGVVELPPGVPQGSEVKVIFDYAADGTMSLRAKEVSTDSECEVRIVRSGVMDAEQLQQAGSKLAVLNAR